MAKDTIALQFRSRCTFEFVLLLAAYSQFCLAQSPSSLPSSEKTAMLELNAGITPSPWNTSDPCFWAGVACNNDGIYDHIISISLSSSSTTTVALPDTLGDLLYLTGLTFSNAIFTRPIPTTVVSIRNLQTLSFEGCSNIEFPTTATTSFSGNIIVTTSDLVNLPPASVFQSLYLLDISRSTLNVTIPPDYGTFTNLNSLRIEQTNLYGTIPPELGNLPKLAFLTLAHNKLSGTIPAQLGDLPLLFSLDLTGNQLTGTIPPQLGKVPNLQVLSLTSNQLTGTIPSEIFTPNLRTLELSNNKLTEPYPNTNQSTQLATLKLANNSFAAGPLPSNFYSIPRLFNFDASNNQFTGSIPTFNSGSLSSLLLANNEFTGSIPTLCTMCSNLQDLDLSGNSLTGVIPNSILRSNWFLLNLTGNSLAGCMSSSNFTITKCGLAGNVMCCPDDTLVCDNGSSQCLDCGTSQPTSGAICMYNEDFNRVWFVNGDIIIGTNSTQIENTVIDGNVITTTNITLNNVVINGNLSVNNAQLTVNNGVIDVRGCAFINGTLILNLTPEEAQQLAANGTLTRDLLLYDASCSDSDVNLDQIVINNEATTCGEAVGTQQNAPGLISILITAPQDCNINEPINGNNTPNVSLPDWAIAVIVVGGCVVLVVIFIIVSVSVPSIRQRVFPYARK